MKVQGVKFDVNLVEISGTFREEIKIPNRTKSLNPPFNNKKFQLILEWEKDHKNQKTPSKRFSLC